ncbi:MAG: STELLO glycosyltransferase family protein [Candidatus Nomurabacteria bacterium]|nr:STELLO glycosyltransferase family protein [Candidatus Nomurabacteria bacterium]
MATYCSRGQKTPQDWECENVIYLSPEDQEKLGFNITKLLPWNHYSRKMIGYLYAIKSGADIIADSDDDNIPYDNWGEKVIFDGQFKTVKNDDYVNIYKFFTNEFIWPRGFPLRGFPLSKILNEKQSIVSDTISKVGVWQYLADKDPDVDAIYRLTNNKEVFFKGKDTLVLGKGTICPFNSQNTFFKKEMFPLLYIPAFVNFRFTDILRGLVAQPIMWVAGYRLGFGLATVVQERNPHDFMKDFESEIPMYLNTEEVVDTTLQSINQSKNNNIIGNISLVYKNLKNKGIVEERENELLDAWCRDLKKM